MFWQGGFTFYAAVVVPVGRGINRDQQSLVTQRVTHYLNAAGAVAVGVLIWEGVTGLDSSHKRRWWRWGMVVLMGLGLVPLVPLHLQMDACMASGMEHDAMIAAMWPYHIAYLWISTLQWVAAVVYVTLTVSAWRVEDRLS